MEEVIMKVDSVFSWVGLNVPEKFSGPGPFEITPEDLADLVAVFDVAFMHRGGGTLVTLALDQPGRGFRQR